MASMIWFFLIFSVVVISHEFGHFLIAKANGIKVLEFFVGFGPTIFSFKKGETKYSLKLLPLGGACVFDGMDGLGEEKREEEEKKALAEAEAKGEILLDPKEEKKGSFLHAPVWARFATIFAGPFFNFILGLLIAFIMVNMIAIREPVASQIMEGGAAEAAGLVAGDRIISMNGRKVCLYEDIVLYNVMMEGQDIVLVYERDGQYHTTELTPTYNEEYGRYMLGIMNDTFLEDLSGMDRMKYTWYEMRYNFMMTWGSLGMLIKGKATTKDVSGPVGIAVNVVGATYENTKEYGWQTVLVNMLNIALMLTINLGVLNLLPIPALDGGRLLFILIEIIRGKPVPPEKEAMVHFIGMMFFMILIVFVFFNDIKNIFM